MMCSYGHGGLFFAILSGRRTKLTFSLLSSKISKIPMCFAPKSADVFYGQPLTGYDYVLCKA